MGKMSRVEVIEKLTQAGVQFDANAGYGELVKLLPTETKTELNPDTPPESEPGEEIPVKATIIPPQVPMPEVPCGATGVADLNRRLCIAENKLGLANWKI